MNVIIGPKDKILIIAPHADDESIGCGGFLALYGRQCDLMLITDGRHGHTKKEYEDEKRLIEIRRGEFSNVGKIAGVKNIKFLNVEDGTTKHNRRVIYQQNIKEYDYIFIPNRNESHTDHKVLLSIIKHMKKRQHAKCQIIEYEVWTPLLHPTWFLDISDVIEEKKRMISQHVSQLSDIDYISKGIALNCYRGAYINVEYAEAYMHEEYSGIKRVLYSIMPKCARNIIKKVIGIRCNE